MKLHEKILSLRKSMGLSQEELAARVGVSRQAVSKWELGESVPDVDKLLALSQIFGVTVDHLLRGGEDDGSQGEESSPAAAPESKTAPRLPGHLGQLVRRWGWLAGVYIALCGLGIAAVGLLARVIYNRMFPQEFFQMFGSTPGFSAPGGPFLTIATAALAAGGVIAVAGVILAVWLRWWGRK